MTENERKLIEAALDFEDQLERDAAPCNVGPLRQYAILVRKERAASDIADEASLAAALHAYHNFPGFQEFEDAISRAMVKAFRRHRGGRE